jgi:hypothetical protein
VVFGQGDGTSEGLPSDTAALVVWAKASGRDPETNEQSGSGLPTADEA